MNTYATNYSTTLKEVKDYAGIDTISGNTLEEYRFIDLLNKSGKYCNLIFTPSLNGVYEKQDAGLYRYKDDRSGVDCISRIELECGSKQTFWINSLEDCRNRWPYGINLLCRKSANNFDVFIKYSKNMKSFFAIDMSWVREQVQEELIHGGYIPSEIGFVTNEMKYSIPWEMFDNNIGRYTFRDDFVGLEDFCTQIKLRRK
jgi:hypothetical protein